MRVLVGIDGSHRAYHALEYVGNLLSPKCDDLVLYFSPPKISLQGNVDTEEDLSEVASKAFTEAVFSRAKQRLQPEMHEFVQTIVGESKPADGILSAAENTAADLIVVGAHSSTRRLQLFLGGTARKVMHHAHCPVLLVRGNTLPTHDPFEVLLACDEDKLWHHAADAMRSLSWPNSARATLLHVVETMDEEQVKAMLEFGHPSIPDAESLVESHRETVDRRKASCRQQLDEARNSLPNFVKEGECEVLQGHVVEQIVERATGENVGLVVVGARRLGPIRRTFGSTTEALMVQCPCSLLVVHEPAKQ